MSVFKKVHLILRINKTNTFTKTKIFLELKRKAPNQYSIPTVLGSSKEAHIRSAPAYTLVGRQKQRPPPAALVPGPGTYDSQYESVLHKSPQFSMGQRISHKIKTEGPGIGSHFPEKVVLLTKTKLKTKN